MSPAIRTTGPTSSAKLHNIDLATACGLQSFPGLSLYRTRANFTDLHGDCPAAPSATPACATLPAVSADRWWKRGVEATEPFLPSSAWPKRYAILPFASPFGWHCSVTHPWRSDLFGCRLHHKRAALAIVPGNPLRGAAQFLSVRCNWVRSSNDLAPHHCRCERV